jgi:hypothetical protein
LYLKERLAKARLLPKEGLEVLPPAPSRTLAPQVRDPCGQHTALDGTKMMIQWPTTAALI